jgi:hypothetical protein
VQQALENALAELVLGAELDLSDRAAVVAWLDRHGVGREDREALLESDLSRLGVYRNLVRHTLRDAVELALPRVVARLGPVFDEYFDAYLAERGPRTHYLRDVTTELLAFCAPRWADDARVAPWTMDLARHEALQIEVAAQPAAQADAPALPLELGQSVRFIEACRLVRYGYAVHRLSEDTSDRSEPLATDTALFVYRSREHEVRYLELTPLAASILERLLAGSPLEQAIAGASAEHGAPLAEAVLTGAAKLLSDLAERGVLLGASKKKLG